MALGGNSRQSSGGRQRQSLDADTTLPLPDDIQAQVDSLEQCHHDNDGGEEDKDAVSDAPLAEAHRLLHLLNTQSSTMMEEDAGALLSHLTKLRVTDDNDVKWNAVNVRLARMAVKSAMNSLNSSNLTNYNYSGGGGPTSAAEGATTTAVMEAKMARRILIDGILPFASSATCSASSSMENHGNGGGANDDASATAATPPSFCIAKLIRSIIVEDLLPTAIIQDTSQNTNSSALESSNASHGSSNSNNATALEILLSTYLTRMDSDEASQILVNDNNGAYTVDDILDSLCGVTSTSTPELTDQPRPRLRPAATAAVLASLRELESNLPGSGGRLSRRRIWKTKRIGGGGRSLQQHQDRDQRECHFEYIDRPTHLLQTALHSLKALSSKTSSEGADPDALPPLVYQLGLLPMGLAGAVTGGGKKQGIKENEKQRGMRLRRMVLEGIASVLDDDDDIMSGENGNMSQIVLHDGDAPSNPHRNSRNNQESEEEAWRFARYTSLSHLGSCLRSDLEMSKAVLSMLAGDIIVGTTNDGSHRPTTVVPPFRYARLTPFKLAMGLSMASSVPRMRTSALSTVRDLIMEEETIRIRRGLGVDATMGSSRPWMDCLVRCLEKMTVVSHIGRKDNGNSDGNHVLGCLIRVAKFAESEHHHGGGGGSGVGCASSLLQSLCQLGFLLVDCVKKDDLQQPSSTTAIQPLAVLASNMDISSFGGTSTAGSTPETSATHATASIGRFVLSYLFYQSAATSSHFLSSSLSSLANNSTKSSSDGGGGTALCRSILRSSMDKFCGMAPNALEHAILLEDLLRFSPLSSLLTEKCSNINSNNSIRMEGLDDRQKEEVIALALASNHLPTLIDTLSNVPGGGMLPHVASNAIVPTVGKLFLLQATQRQGLGSLWKKTDVQDHVDHAFLLAKKSLFSANVEKRKCAATLLVTLLGVAAVASSSSGSRSARSTWSSILYDMKGCLRRCLTQHQSVVRMEAYSSLVALLPKSAASSDANMTQDSTSPASSKASGGAATPPPSSSLRRHNKIAARIPPAGETAVVCIVSELLLSSLERYVTVPNEEWTDREARRKRSAAQGGAGLSQMEAFVEEELPDDRTTTKKDGQDKPSNPFRFEKCISTRPSHLHYDHGNKKKKKGGGGNNKNKKSKTTPIGQLFLTEALHRINEPLSFLIASCIATAPLLEMDEGDDDECNQDNEMKKTLFRIRDQMARCADIDEYLKWTKSSRHIFEIKDNAKRTEEMAICKLATLVLVAAVSDIFLNICEWKSQDECNVVVMENADNNGGISEPNNDIEDLFSLRAEAIDEAAEIMSSFISAKSSQTKKTSTRGSKKKLNEVDVTNVSSSQQSSSEPKPPTKKKGGTSVEEDGGVTSTITKVKTSEINDATRARNRKLVSDAIHNLCPAMNHEFLAGSLRKFGVEVSKKACDDVDSDDDDDVDDEEAATRLSKCLAFRRFIITKSLLLMSGSSLIVRAGARFGALAVCATAATDRNPTSTTTMRIAASLTLGPLLFLEFCAHSYKLEQTSIVIASSSSELSLAQLSMRAFTACVRGMTCDAPQHAMSKASRVYALLTSAMGKVSFILPSSKDGWNYYRELVYNGDACVGVPDDEVRLGKALVPFISLETTTTSSRSSNNKKNDESNMTTTRLCLFSELLSNGMHREAMECGHLISSAAEAFTEPNMKEQLGVFLLRAWEFGPSPVEGDCSERVGVLGLDHGEEDNGNKMDTCCVSSAIKVAMKLNCGLDGNTHVPLPDDVSVSSSSSGDYGLRAARSKMGLPMTLVKNWPEKHQARLEKELRSTSGMIVIGMGTQVAWALSATLDIGKHFTVTFDKNSPTKKQLKLDLIKAAAKTSDANFAKEKVTISNTISSSINDALNNADFVTLKIIPHTSDGSLDLAQRFVSCLLFSVSKMISASAPSADFLDENGSFASMLLKNTKHLYGILTKLVLSFMSNPRSLASNETKCFLDYLTATLMPRMSALLLTLQEKQETAGGKFLAESKIESHGKISALLVFEKEKLDNALLKLGAKMKQVGLEEDSEWLEDHVVTNLNRDFVIRRVKDAKAREAPKTKKKKPVSSGPKRKVKSEPTTGKKNKKKKQRADPENEEEDGSDVDDANDASAMESVDGESVGDADGDDDVISLSRLTASMEEEEEEEDNESEEDSEQEEEAEFDE